MNNPDNKLHDETSPYLRQHADNPVNWHPWNAHSLNLAKQQNKPILLSIGYSACHWCHVMAVESFENDVTAKIMNQYFINIKVDREERPDLDKIYQSAHSLLTSRAGGWPLTVFLSPINQMPFFAGTYFPDKPRYNQPAFEEILQLVSGAYENKQTEILQQEEAIGNAFKDMSIHTPTQARLNSLPLDLVRKQMDNAFDKQHGGFSQAPKFPHPDMLERCLRHYLFLLAQKKTDTHALHMLTFTLDKMALGGFNDQIDGGFFRYSTDELWMIPHFEKMLNDNAQLLNIYTRAYAVNKKPLYKQIINSTADWIIQKMQTSEGGYCSALAADTEHVEGLTYVWTSKQIQHLLTSEELFVFEKKYNLSATPNFEGNWHLHSNIANEALADTLNLDLQTVNKQLTSAKTKLLNERNTRKQPARDDKILCAWNALMIRSMAQAGKRLKNQDYINSAIKAVDFIYNLLWKDRRLLVSYKDGKANLNAYLDDYAYLLQALIEILQAQWSNTHFQWAMEIAESLLENFEDTSNGGFFFTSHDHENLLYRSKIFADDAMPNGNAVAASALLQLGYLCSDNRYLDSAERTLRCAHEALNDHPISHCSLLHALEFYLQPNIIIVLRGKNTLVSKWQDTTLNRYIPRLVCIAINDTISLPNTLKDKKIDGDICAYICEGTTCLPTIYSETEFTNYLNEIDLN